jgi:3-oxoacyl-[acyl-carrier-protein] synthase II
MRRAFVTGIGIISNVGFGCGEFLAALRRGLCGVSEFRAWNTLGFPFANGGEIHSFEPANYINRLDPQAIGRTSHFAVAAAKLALVDAHLEEGELGDCASAVSIGTTDGESRAMDDLVRTVVEKGYAGARSPDIKKVLADRVAVSVASELGISGEVLTIATACAAGNYAVGNAYDLIRAGEADVVLCGGAESIARKSLAGFYRLGAMSKDICRPFDRNRSGIIAGEGAAMLTVESFEHASRRSAPVYAEILGYALSCDATHTTAPDEDSIVKCMTRSHTNAGISAADVSYVCAHGTGTKVNDAMEARALKRVFGPCVPPVSSIKGMIGHTMGAASAMGAAACCLAIRENFIPPTVNFEQYDSDCDLDTISNVSREKVLNVVQNNGFGFGGNNAIVIFGRVGSSPLR